MDTRDFLVPDNYADFHCKCGKCRHTCCDGWAVTFPREDYFRLLSVPCSPELRRKLDTSLHLADVRAEYPGKHNVTEHSAVLENGRRVWKAYDTLYVDGQDFEALGADFEKACAVARTALGNGQIAFMRQRTLVDFAVDWMQTHRQ